MKRRTKNRSSRRFERLEERRMQTVVGIDAQGDLLIDMRKDGSRNDHVVVSNVGNTWEVYHNGTYRNFPKSSVGAYIECYLGDGNDYFENRTTLIADVEGGNGNDRLIGGPALDEFNGGAGNDVLEGRGGDDRLYGEAGNDWISGDAGNDYCHGGTGNDTIYGNIGNDTLDGYTGDDQLWGYYGNDILYGSHGNDTLRGEAGYDKIYGEAGNDWLDGGSEDDYLHGGTGDDVLYGGLNNDTLDGYHGNDTLWGYYGDDKLMGSFGDDKLHGEWGNDKLFGEDGNDIYYFDADFALGSDVVEEFSGTDTLDFSATTTVGVSVNLGTTITQVVCANHRLTLTQNNAIERLIGGAGADTLIGNTLKNVLKGGGGGDLIVSIDGAVSDYVDGGAGADIMWVDRRGVSKDSVYGASKAGIVHEVDSFANGADRTLNGDRIADPLDSGTRLRFNGNPLFSSRGPRVNDVRQGLRNDCWLLAGLGAIANNTPLRVRQNVVDFGDGTYGVRLRNSFYRVDNDLPVYAVANGATATNVRFAGLGLENSMWVAVVEKAFAHYRTGANTYVSLDSGLATAAFSAFRLNNVSIRNLNTFATASAMAADLSSRVAQGYSITIGSIAITDANGQFQGFHELTVAGLTRNAAGVVTRVILRNPWGYDGIARFNVFAGADTLRNEFDGFFSVTVNQVFASGGSIGFGKV